MNDPLVWMAVGILSWCAGYGAGAMIRDFLAARARRRTVRGGDDEPTPPGGTAGAPLRSSANPPNPLPSVEPLRSLTPYRQWLSEQPMRANTEISPGPTPEQKLLAFDRSKREPDMAKRLRRLPGELGRRA